MTPSRAGLPASGGPGIASGRVYPPAERRSVLDRAHRGDIEGALGRVPLVRCRSAPVAAPPAATLLAIMGPGLVVMVGRQRCRRTLRLRAGRAGLRARLLWVLLLLTRAVRQPGDGRPPRGGHRRRARAADLRALRRRWGAFALGDLLAVNILTIVTEFIGVGLALATSALAATSVPRRASR